MTATRDGEAADDGGRRRAAAAFLASVALSTLLNLVWEVLQLPLYTISTEGAWGEVVLAIVHCTADDALISAGSLGIAVATAGRGWPERGYARSVALLAVALGVGYTILSEYWNVSVRGTWAYADSMPILPWIGTGLAPLLQWVVVPVAALTLMRALHARVELPVVRSRRRLI